MTMTSAGEPWIELDPRQVPGRVLVGFDNSAGAEHALDWAIREAAARGSSLTVGSSDVLIGKANNTDLLVLAASVGTRPSRYYLHRSPQERRDGVRARSS